MKFLRILSPFATTVFSFGIAINSPNALAEGHGGGGGGGDGGYIKVEPFTVNLLGGSQYLQMSMRLKGGSPEVATNVANRMPMVRHALILLLSGHTSEEVLSVKGKTLLLEELKNSVNKAIGMSGNDGVSAVALESFIVQ